MNARIRVSEKITSPEDQKVTFVELFFDLVFVFSVTQVVDLLHGGFDWLHAGQAVLIFWIVWWAWTQYTWALNAADTTHTLVELAVLVATALAFFMAIAVPEAFREGALRFAVPYVLMRGFGLVLYGWVAGQNPSQHAAVRTFSLVSLSGLAAVLLGAVLGGAAQYWLWGLAILLDVVAAGVGGQLEGWDLHPEHFAERHGLIVIIALGESLIVAAAGASSGLWRGELVAVAVLAVAVTCALWWSYFTRAKPALDQALESRSGSAQSSMGRDVFSLLHFPILGGIVAYAAVVEEMMIHPDEPPSFMIRLTLAIGVVFFLGGTAVAVWRATGRILIWRLALSAATAAAILLLTGSHALLILSVLFVGVAAAAFVEQRSKHLVVSRPI